MSPVESPTRIEPCMLDRYPARLADLIAAVVAHAAELGGRLRPLAPADRREPGGSDSRHELQHGEQPRGELTRASGLAERTARNLLRRLLDERLVASTTPKGPVSLRFPSHAAEALFPRLYPAQAFGQA